MGGKTIGREAILSVVEKGQQGGEEKMATYIAVVIIAVVISLIVATATAVIISIICCNISAMKTFNTIDEYVKDLIDSTMKLIRDTYFDK